MTSLKPDRIFSFALLAVLAGIGSLPDVARAAGIDVSATPLGVNGSVTPLMMLVMSRDEQLFVKAYDDYSDLDGDGKIDTTYYDKFNYAGYFDSTLCYTYDSTNNYFKPSAAATGTHGHACSSAWSGNFMNWVSMSRMDEVASVLDGGRRSSEPATGGAVLERAPIPADLHAWVKVYTGSDIASYTPYSPSTGSISLCNATMGDSGTAPTIRIADGAYTEWASTAGKMCQWQGTEVTSYSGDNSYYDDAPSTAALATPVARVLTCADTSHLESFCQAYTNSSGTTVYRPVGLLQQYGENDKLRFGLLTGSFSKPRSGGVLRRNIGKFIGNGATQCASTDDEVDTSTGKFCSSGQGTISTLQALSINPYYSYSGNNWSVDCGTYGILNRGSGTALNDPGTGSYNCAAWGNPLSEMYAEALRYISTPSPTTSSPTATFNASGDLTGLPANVAWKDPYRSVSSGGNEYCANCSVLILSTGLNSFDSDEIPTVAALPSQAAALTTTVGADEGISGSYSIGRVASGTPGDLAVGQTTATYADLCTPKTLTDLSLARGLCPDIPAMEGSYLLAGLAYGAWTNDLRPDLTTSAPTGNLQKPSGYKETVKTFSVALARNLPTFSIPVGSSSISLAPLCQANNSGSADALGTLGSTNDSGWRSCFLGAVTLGTKTANPLLLTPTYTYGRSFDTSTTPQYGSFGLVWEDSLWGNDHENDVVNMVTYCVGSACTDQTQQSKGLLTNLNGTSYSGYDICWRAYGTTGTTSSTAGGFTSPGAASTTADPYGNASPCPSDGKPSVAADEVLIRIENLSAYAGNAMLTGYNITGSDNDGIKRLALRPGNDNGSILTQTTQPRTSWYAPIVLKFKAGTGSVKQLQNPLYYAAKYGSFNDKNLNGKPDAGEWDTLQSGTPDNFFAVTDPTKLKAELQQVFASAAKGSISIGSISASATRITSGSTPLAYQASYAQQNTAGTAWTGELAAYVLNADGSLGTQKWGAAEQLPSGARSDIWVGVPNGTTPQTYAAKSFQLANLADALQASLLGAFTGTTPTTPLGTADAATATNLIAWLSGDQSNEQGQTTGAQIFRQRDTSTGRLGDIVGSSPQVQTNTSNGWQNLPATINGVATGSGGYATFVAGKSTNPVVYVGANDGMLHAFDGTTTASGGSELFAYIPEAVVANLGTLARPDYTHQYFVDGTPALGDAYIAGHWKTLLLESTGAGARSVFALDVTDPHHFSASSLLWEFNDQIDSDMGQLIGSAYPPAITEDGNWVTAFGNGYNGAGNHAVLFVLNVEDGTEIAKVDTHLSAETDANGMSSAIVVDSDGNGAGDTIYAADYQGNVWKFVCGSISGGKCAWTNPLAGGAPLFIATDQYGHRQPITGGLFAAPNPVGGTMVYFGTGKYLDSDDNNPKLLQSDGTPLVNSVYAIWDEYKYKATVSTGTIARSDLQAQTVTSYTGGVLQTSANLFDYATAGVSGKLGWYLDLTVGSDPANTATNTLLGERVVSAPTGFLGTMEVSLYRPVGDTCVPGGQNSLYVASLLNGTPAGGTDSTGTAQIAGQDTTTGAPTSTPTFVLLLPSTSTIASINCTPGTNGCTTLQTPTMSACKVINVGGLVSSTPLSCRVSWRQLR
ncbi:MAG: PilC/PilY family type IV pilus protein [Rudaea sp.]|uniref:pilus assembly protein n=1 Tax=Rudaea sp. TaxID=2136325 RepID=UPI0039E2EDB7